MGVEVDIPKDASSISDSPAQRASLAEAEELSISRVVDVVGVVMVVESALLSLSGRGAGMCVFSSRSCGGVRGSLNLLSA